MGNVGPTGPAGPGLVVRDSQGTLVGPVLLDPTSYGVGPLPTVWIARLIGDSVVLLTVNGDGFANQGVVYYASDNCSGQPLLQPGNFSISNFSAPTLVKAVVNNNRAFVPSEGSVADYTVGSALYPGGCGTPPSPSPTQLEPADTIDLVHLVPLGLGIPFSVNLEGQ